MKNSETIKKIIETNNDILGWERELRELEGETHSPIFDLEKWLKKRDYLKDKIYVSKDQLEKLYREMEK